jgi:hypothetical protein
VYASARSGGRPVIFWTAYSACVKVKPVARTETKTAVLPDGLRYKSKVSGSPFVATTSFGSATMSCFLCGKHRPRSMMGTKKVLGKAQAVCAPSCKELDAQLAKK